MARLWLCPDGLSDTAIGRMEARPGYCLGRQGQFNQSNDPERMVRLSTIVSDERPGHSAANVDGRAARNKACTIFFTWNGWGTAVALSSPGQPFRCRLHRFTADELSAGTVAAQQVHGAAFELSGSKNPTCIRRRLGDGGEPLAAKLTTGTEPMTGQRPGIVLPPKHCHLFGADGIACPRARTSA